VQPFLFVAAAACSQLFCGLLGKYILVSGLNNTHIIRQGVFFSGYNFQWLNQLHGSLSLMWQFVHAVLKHGDFLETHSQSRVAMHLRCGGIFNHVTANLLQNQPVKEF